MITLFQDSALLSLTLDSARVVVIQQRRLVVHHFLLRLTCSSLMRLHVRKVLRFEHLILVVLRNDTHFCACRCRNLSSQRDWPQSLFICFWQIWHCLLGQLTVQTYRIWIVPNEHGTGRKSRRHLFLRRLLRRFVVLTATGKNWSLLVGLDSTSTSIDQTVLPSFLRLFHGIHFATTIGLSEGVVIRCTSLWFGILMWWCILKSSLIFKLVLGHSGRGFRLWRTWIIVSNWLE